MPRLTLPLLICATLVAFSQEGAVSKRILSKKYGFSLEQPQGWRAAVGANTELPLFANFPWSRLQGNAILPSGGATIHILAEDELSGQHHDHTLEEWAEFDERGAARNTITRRELSLPPSTEISRIMIIGFDGSTESTSEQRQHDLAAYWEFRGKRFATHLFYVLGDPKAKEYNAIMIKLMRSIRPL